MLRLRHDSHGFSHFSCLPNSLVWRLIQAAVATKQLGLRSHPDNHGAICSDPAERLAHTSQGMDDSGYRAPGNHLNVFPVNLDLPDASPRRLGDSGAEPAAITESARATSPIVPL